jgi:hypothetical protein
MGISTRHIGVALVFASLVAAAGYAIAQMPPGHMTNMPDTAQHSPMAGMHSAGMMQNSGAPTLPGQDAFGAIQEIVRILEADPNTDWAKVKLSALREHLIDMNEVTLKADAAEQPSANGIVVAVTGSGRTLAAIRRMVPAHAQELNGYSGWSASTETLPDGVRLTVTATDPKEVAHVQGLGFIGLLVSGTHHQPHHLAIAKGEFAHRH